MNDQAGQTTHEHVEPLDLAPLADIIARHHAAAGGALIPVLQEAQAHYGFLPEAVVEETARGLGLPVSTVYGVVTFYAQFHLTPRGRYTIRSCQGTACHVKGGKTVLGAIERALGIRSGETTHDLRFTLETVACLGCCFLAPAIMIDDQYFGNLTPRDVDSALEQFK
ncbi:MAG: NADH-quinone oxidoreductase subunit NuoE [Armatimonadota bacterium]|nr:MAG: NADH-quinone oxidoreductase subunit NuoE [Armatimonadota bacterium]